MLRKSLPFDDKMPLEFYPIYFPRDNDVSHSEFGQWIHDWMPRDFYSLDIDQLTYKRKTNILRILEEKCPGQNLKKSQKAVFPFLQKAIEILVACKLLAKGSGVFIVWGVPPYKKVKVRPWGSGRVYRLTCEELKELISGEPFEWEYIDQYDTIAKPLFVPVVPV